MTLTKSNLKTLVLDITDKFPSNKKYELKKHFCIRWVWTPFPPFLHSSSRSQVGSRTLGQTENRRGPEKRLTTRRNHCSLTPGMKCVSFWPPSNGRAFSFSLCSICGSIHGDNDLQSWERGGWTSGRVYLAHMVRSPLSQAQFIYQFKQE